DLAHVATTIHRPPQPARWLPPLVPRACALPSMIPAAARTMHCYRLDAPGESIEDTLSGFDLLFWPEDVDPRLPSLLEEVSFATHAAWIRTFLTPRDLRGMPWWKLFGSNHGWST